MKAALVFVVGCAAAAKPPAPVALVAAPAIDVHANAVVEQGDALYVLAGNIAMIVRGGVVVTRAEAPKKWRTGASIAAPDGNGRWVIAIDEDGVPWHLTLSGEREAVADRLGLGGAHVVSIVANGSSFAADLGDAIVYTTDGVHLARVPAADTAGIALARGVLARATKGAVERWDLAHGTRTSFQVTATAVAFADDRLVVSTKDRSWIETPHGLVPLNAPPFARADRGWLAAAGTLYAFDGTHAVPTQPHGDLLAASSTGDAWLATDKGLVRYSRTASADDPLWQSQVAPVFQRVCAHCHLPGGEAGIDLSTPASWTSEHDEIARRVLVTRTMPPAGTDLSDSDRAALEHWLGTRRVP